MNLVQTLHLKAIECAKRFRRSESEMLEILIECEKHRVFIAQGYPSLFRYCTDCLKLSESQSYAFISVARKSREVPELKSHIDSGEITLSNARRLVSVINPENKDIWLEKGSLLSQKQLEKEIVKVKPESIIPKERIKPLTQDKRELRVVITEDLEKKLERLKDVLAQKRQRHCTLEEALLESVNYFLEKQDPLEKAKRLCSNTVEAKTDNPGVRTQIPAPIKHTVTARDSGQCTHILNGKRCEQKRWLHIHHRTPVSQGGGNSAQNLVTLCSAHHKLTHEQMPMF